ncbi:MAG: DUF1553 domain-containing protein [Planctomycetales bacterium]|nr:DUF1553 domain-containing protein [Planctomycetales bacterium]
MARPKSCLGIGGEPNEFDVDQVKKVIETTNRSDMHKKRANKAFLCSFEPWCYGGRYFLLNCFLAMTFLATPVRSQELRNAQTLVVAEQDSADFFEQHIRPALIEHCYACHAIDTEANGGLVLDSPGGWQAGGESGPVIEAGKPEGSRLLLAMTYQDPDLQMPPDGKLPQEIITAFRDWIAAGAVDPRPEMEPSIAISGLPVDEAEKHWAYRPLLRPRTPAGETASTSLIDKFIDIELAAKGLQGAPPADSGVLIRRLYFDLLGLPPPPEVAALHQLDTETEYLHLVDSLLSSPHFGEHFARKWMDVVRYAESITLRGFVLPEAWRYRDYLVQAYAEDRPFDQMIREQIAGDLLEHSDLRERQMQLVATSFLAMGNNNLEQQDKLQLEMDYLDEQLETIGRAFLGQTLGCARCHDHKFDPIPMRDYYALAGTLRSAVALEHANLSMWIEQPLPLPALQEERFEALNVELQQISVRIDTLNKNQPNLDSKRNKQKYVAIDDLAGTVVDDSQAKLVGHWKDSSSVGPIVGTGYRHDEDSGKGAATATFEPLELAPGWYDVRLSYSAASNRASNVRVVVFSADGQNEVEVNQQQPPDIDGLWKSLGKYRFEDNSQAFVLVSNADSNGHVIVDAVQFLPLNGPSELQFVDTDNNADSEAVDVRAALADELKQLEKRKQQLEAQLEARPRFLTVVEKLPPVDVPIHIRGDVHNLGSPVPRGFLTALRMPEATTKISESSSGRRELAEWLSSEHNPLTARVYANRVWSWLMGQGLVSTPNNLGTTGASPSHPELLDWLAAELIDSGWSTKHLVRLIVCSEAYRRRLLNNSAAEQIDPGNQLYWKGQSRRLSPEAMRDAMLQISGELDMTFGGSLIRAGTKADYDYQHATTRRSIYHPVFRNSLPELFEAFDFADPSVSIGSRSRSTVATQPLSLLNHPWVAARAKSMVGRIRSGDHDPTSQELINSIFEACYARLPSDDELLNCLEFLNASQTDEEVERLELLIHSLFAALDFRYLE